MGGIGSGQYWRHGSKETTEDYMPLDIRRWTQEGLLVPGNYFGWQRTCNDKVTASIRVQVETNHVNLIYRHRSGGGEWKDENYPVYLEWTACNLGGKRPWFFCPARGCGRRVAILYGGGIFACRHCHELAYPSQRETYDDRAARRADRIRDKLGWELGILNGDGWKPKGMHWSTFERLTVQHDAFVQISLGGIVQRFNMLGESPDDLF
ncbi:MAG: hypothetical protein GY934_14285 [Gammaproteobacteria bacterium]|nr:hypothetical protein [Gammaproteobacteria bacterium]